MSRTVTEFCLNELGEWNTSIEFYLDLVDESFDCLSDILKLSTSEQSAIKARYYFNQLILVKQNLRRQLEFIRLLHARMFRGNITADHCIVSPELRQQLKELRKSMQSIEKDYLQLKYECDEFISDTLSIQFSDN